MTTLTTPQTHALRDQLLARKEQLLQELDAVQVAHRERMKSADSAPQDAYATQANQVAESAVRDADARRAPGRHRGGAATHRRRQLWRMPRLRGRHRPAALARLSGGAALHWLPNQGRTSGLTAA